MTSIVLNSKSKSIQLKADIDPRKYQQRIVTTAIQMFQGEYKNRNGNIVPKADSVMIESPTGSGKTVMGLLIAQYFQKQPGSTIRQPKTFYKVLGFCNLDQTVNVTLSDPESPFTQNSCFPPASFQTNCELNIS